MNPITASISHYERKRKEAAYENKNIEKFLFFISIMLFAEILYILYSQPLDNIEIAVLVVSGLILILVIDLITR